MCKKENKQMKYLSNQYKLPYDMRVGIQTKSLIGEEDIKLEVGYKRVADSGITNLDYNITWTPYKDGEEEGEIDYGIYPRHLECAKKYGIKFSQVHSPRGLAIEEDNDLTHLVEAIENSLKVCQLLESPYLVVHPIKQTEWMTCQEAEEICFDYFEQIGRLAVSYGIVICIENLHSRYNGKVTNGICSQARDVVRYIEEVNKRIGAECFGACFDVGHANIMRLDLRTEVETLGEHLKVLHIHDNNGDTDDHQLPYTFSNPRTGESTTEWDGFLYALRKIGYDGVLSFEPYRALISIPIILQTTLLSYLYEIGASFRHVLEFDKIFEQYSHKKLILVGAGKMFDAFMNEFGEKNPPIFVVDNNSDLWGTQKKGIPIRDPKDILLIPEEERVVIVCNAFVNAIALQLEEMGVNEYLYCEEVYRMQWRMF